MRGPAAAATGALASVAAVLVVVGAGWQVPAAAHISLVSSDPAPGQRFQQVPEQARLEFSEPVSEPAYAVVTAPDGGQSDPGAVRVGGDTVVVDLPAGPDGTWALAFRVVSRDGHPVSGRVDFVVGDGALAPPVADPGATSGGPPDRPDRERGTATGVRASDEGGAGGPSLGQVQMGIAVGLFAAAAVLLLLAGPLPGRRGRAGRPGTG